MNKYNHSNKLMDNSTNTGILDKFNSPASLEKIENIEVETENFLKRKRKEADDKEFSNICNRATQDEAKHNFCYSDEKITDFFKLKKINLKTLGNNLTSKNLTDELDYKQNFEFEKIGQLEKNIIFEKTEKNSTIVKESPKKKKEIKRLDKDIKDYFKEYKLSTKTLNTLKKGKFIDNKLKNNLNLNLNLSLSVNNLPITSSHRRTDKNIKDAESILKSLSMKEKYEGLLKRELILPTTYKLLHLQFIFLDQCIKTLKFEKNVKINIEKINEACREKDFRIGFTQEDFQKILHVAPISYLYKYEMIKNIKGFEILIDIPSDFENRMKTNFSNNTFEFQKLQSLEIHKPIDIMPSEESLNQRSKFFKDILIHITKVQHDKFLKKRNIKFDAVKYCTWHSDFNIDEVDKVKTFALLPKPNKKANRV